MRLEPGQRLAHYDVLALLGRGGMGEVWRASDTRLGREVALKILPEEFTRDPERLRRFEREARLLASLEHHGIASIHGIEVADDERFLVMQLAEGEDLSARLARGALPLDEAIDIARQIAAALEAAHERGVVHRDLKPGNVKVAPGGEVKVLDFGLAFTPDVEPETPDDLTNSPTMARGLTGSGAILGTVAYMSPEQARGKRVDRRSDLWALGVVLWEMLTGESLFGGATVSDTLAAVLRNEVDLSKLPPATPPAVRRLLRRCLERDPRRRLADAATARIELEEAAEELEERAPLPIANAPRRRGLWLVSAAIILVIAVAGTLFLSRKETRSPADRAGLRFDLSGISFNTVSSVAISPDGETIAYVPYDPTAQGKLHLRSLRTFDSTAIEGTEGAVNPFFSPDGERIGYFTYDALYVVKRQGETPVRIAAVSAQGESGYWTEDGTIYFSGALIGGRRERGISKIPASGGVAQPVTKIAAGEIDHRQPSVAGKWLLFTTSMIRGFDSAALSLTDGTRRPLWRGAGSPVYSPTGHVLLYTPATLTLAAVPFDLETGNVSGTPRTVVSNVFRQDRGEGAFALSRSGTLVYTPSDAGATRTGAYGLVWVDRNGAVAPIIDRRDSWTQPRISPDGRTIVVRQTIVPDCALWSIDTTRSLAMRLTSRRDYHMPSWHPAGGRILAAVGHGDDSNPRRLIDIPADGSGAERFVSPEGAEAEEGVWSPDGRSIAWVRWSEESGMDIDLMDSATGESRPFTRDPYDELSPRYSPDGKWLAYTSNESGVPEVFVRQVDGPARRIQVSRDGGAGPVWSRDGNEIFYGSRGRLMAVGITPGVELELSVPRELFTGNFVWERADNFDVSPDGTRFVMIQRSTADRDTELLRVALDWTEDLERLRD